MIFLFFFSFIFEKIFISQHGRKFFSIAGELLNLLQVELQLLAFEHIAIGSAALTGRRGDASVQTTSTKELLELRLNFGSLSSLDVLQHRLFRSLFVNGRLFSFSLNKKIKHQLKLQLLYKQIKYMILYYIDLRKVKYISSSKVCFHNVFYQTYHFRHHWSYV